MPPVEMQPMYVPGVQNNPKPGPYFELIRAAQASGQEYWQIWHLFAFRPELTLHLARLTHEALRGPSPLSPGLRELIAAYTSYLNHCEFCANSHVAIAAEFLGEEAYVWGIVRDLENSSLPEKEKALLRFAAKVTSDLPSIAAEDSDRLRQAGWTDEAIYDAVTVCALFNFYNRWITATGVHAVSPEGHRSRAKVVAAHGYARK